MALLRDKDGHHSFNSFLTTYPSFSRVLQCLVLSKLCQFSFNYSLNGSGDDSDDDDDDDGDGGVVMVSIWVLCKI